MNLQDSWRPSHFDRIWKWIHQISSWLYQHRLQGESQHPCAVRQHLLFSSSILRKHRIRLAYCRLPNPILSVLWPTIYFPFPKFESFLFEYRSCRSMAGSSQYTCPEFSSKCRTRGGRSYWSPWPSSLLVMEASQAQAAELFEPDLLEFLFVVLVLDVSR